MTPAQARRQRRELMKDIEREHKRSAREKLASLRHQIRDARGLRRVAIAHARQRCKAERIAARARAREIRRAGLEALREAVRLERANARSQCTGDLSAARAIADKVARARGELAAEKSYQRELKRIERANRARVLEHRQATRRERRGESDDEVRGNLPPEFVALFDRVSSRIRGSERVTRTEAFLQYAHDHPGELLEVLEDKTDAMIRELEAKERHARRDLRRKAPREAVSHLPPAPF